MYGKQIIMSKPFVTDKLIETIHFIKLVPLFVHCTQVICHHNF